MFASRNQTSQVVMRRTRIAMCVLPALAIGILTVTWLTNRGWQPLSGLSTASAAETPPADGSAAVPKDEPSGQPHAAKPDGTSHAQAPAIEYFPRPTKYEARIIEALDKPTSVEWADLKLEDCIAFLKEQHKINIWMDRQTLIDEGVALDQPITLKAAGFTLRSILKLLLEPVQLTYVIEDDVMKITTSVKASEKLSTPWRSADGDREDDRARIVG